MTGELIKARRLELGLTLEDVGNAVGVGKSTVRKWEMGMISNMKRDKIAKLANILHINPADLIDSNPMSILSDTEMELLEAFRSADPVFQQEAMEMLRRHPKRT